VDLEILYARDPIVFNGINTIVQAFFSAGYRVVCANTREQKIMDAFLKRTNFRYLLLKIIQHICIYGNAWIEKIYDTAGRLIALDWIDPKSVDFLRDTADRIIYERDGLPRAYVQYVDWDIDLKEAGIPERRIITQRGKNAIRFEREQIAHFMLFTVGDSLNGIGLIEPIYNISRAKLNIEEGLAQFTYRKGQPLIQVQIGDERHPPTKDEIKDMAVKLRDLSAQNEFVTPYYYNFKVIESRYAERKQEQLSHYINQQVAGIGVPAPFITGLGEKTNKATLTSQKELFEGKIRMMQETLAKTIRNEIFAVLAKQHNFRMLPRIEFEEISIETLNAKAARLVDYVKAGLLKPDLAIRNIIRRAEKLPEEEEADAKGGEKGAED